MRRVHEVMSRRVVSVGPGTTLADAVEILASHQLSGVPVVDRTDRLLGIVTESALIDVIFDAEVWRAPVSDYMVQDFQTLTANDSLSRAAQLFALHSFQWLPVVDGERLIGVINRRDLMRHTLNSRELLREPLWEMFPVLETV
jgi:CBS domain-containing protein